MYIQYMSKTNITTLKHCSIQFPCQETGSTGPVPSCRSRKCHLGGNRNSEETWHLATQMEAARKKRLAGTFAIKIIPWPDSSIRMRLFLLIHATQHANHSNHSQIKLFSISARIRVEGGSQEIHSEQNLRKRKCRGQHFIDAEKRKSWRLPEKIRTGLVRQQFDCDNADSSPQIDLQTFLRKKRQIVFNAAFPN